MLVEALAAVVLATSPVPAVNPRRLARAQKRYDKFWNKASGYYGATGKPTPRITFGGNSTVVGADGEGMREVRLADDMVRRLGSRRKAGSKQKTRALRSDRNFVKSSLLHEWAHVHQSPETFSSVSDRESGAALFTDRVSRRLLPKKKRVKRVLTPNQQNFLNTRGWGYVNRGQFGSNWGRDPRTIRF